jgi:hypothetical protein
MYHKLFSILLLFYVMLFSLNQLLVTSHAISTLLVPRFNLKTKLQSISSKVSGKETHWELCSLAPTILLAGLVCFARLSFSVGGFEVFLMDIRHELGISNGEE